ncbi:MAG: hypothetical protein QG621_488 [Patescibacteria group bacterium]|nr:hypothetical protein [Patescibacteria group bacterium]
MGWNRAWPLLLVVDQLENSLQHLVADTKLARLVEVEPYQNDKSQEVKSPVGVHFPLLLN